MNRLKEAMMLLIANEAPLGPEWLDHPLKGQWDGHRECHIGGDFLLAYKLADGVPPGSSFSSGQALTPTCSGSEPGLSSHSLTANRATC